MINNYYVIDSHCHIYPEKIAAAAVAHTDAFYDTVSDGLGLVSHLLESGKQAGVDRFIVQSVATTPKQVKSINTFVANQVSEHKELIGLGTLHPDSTDLKGDLEYLLSLGLKGVKLHPDMQDFKIDDFRALRIYELCEEYGVPILFHAGDNRYDRSNPNRLAPVAKNYSQMTVIAAHFGGWSIWEQASNSLSELKNVYVDCSSSLPYISKETAIKIIKTYGADKVLFGTDYPMWNHKKELEAFLSLGLSEQENKKILSENAIKIFKLEALL